MFYHSMLLNCVREMVAMKESENYNNLESKDRRHSCSSGGGEGHCLEIVEFVRSESERATTPRALMSTASPSREPSMILGGEPVDQVVDKSRPRSSLLEDRSPHVPRKSSASTTLRDQQLQKDRKSARGKARGVKSLPIISSIYKRLVYLRILAYRGTKLIAPRLVSKSAVTSCGSQDRSETVGKRRGVTEVEGAGRVCHLGGRVSQERSNLRPEQMRTAEGRTKTPHQGEKVTESSSDVQNGKVTNAAVGRRNRCIIGKSLHDLCDVLDSQKRSSGSTVPGAHSRSYVRVSSATKNSEPSPPAEGNSSVSLMPGETKQNDSTRDYHHERASRQAEKKSTRLTTIRKNLSSPDNPIAKKQGLFRNSPCNWVKTKKELAGNVNSAVDLPPATLELESPRSVRYRRIDILKAEVSENEETKTKEDLPATGSSSTKPLPGTLKRQKSRGNIIEQGSETQETKPKKHLAKTRNCSKAAPPGALKRQMSRLARFRENVKAEGSEKQEMKTNKNLAETLNSGMEPPPATVKPQKSRSARFWENLKGLGEESCNQEEKGARGDVDVFNEIMGESRRHRQLRYEQFRQLQSSKRASKKIKEMHQQEEALRQEREEKMKIACELDPQIIRWCSGKEADLRGLLISLQNVLWPECTMWKVVSSSDLESPSSVKKVYRRASFCLHPDKVQQRGGTLKQIYISEKVFGVLREAWNKFHAEELI